MYPYQILRHDWNQHTIPMVFTWYKKQNFEKGYFYSGRKLSCSLDVEGMGCPEYLNPLVIWTFSRNSNNSSSIKGFINIDTGNIYLPREFHLRNKTNWFEILSLRSILNLNNHTTALEQTKTMIYTSRKQVYSPPNIVICDFDHQPGSSCDHCPHI